MQNSNNKNRIPKNKNKAKKPITGLVKFGIWEEPTEIGALPLNFDEFVALLSKFVYPNNFSLSYIFEDFSTICIEREYIYKQLIEYLSSNEIYKAKFYINLYKIEDDNLIKSSQGQVIKLTIKNFVFFTVIFKF